MAAVFPTGNYDTAVTNLSTTNETTIFTVPTAYRAVYVIQIIAADTGGSARTITLKATKGGTDYTLVSAAAIAANTPYEFTELKPLTLLQGESLKATASNGSVHVFVNYHGQAR